MIRFVWFVAMASGSFLLTFETAFAQGKTEQAAKPGTVGKIEVIEQSFRDLIDPDASIEILAEGFTWSEGPVWVPDQQCLLFSDVPHNRIYKWQPGKPVAVFMDKSGLEGDQESAATEPGSNGLALDAAGRLLVCDHGNRRVYRVEKEGSKTTLADKFEGKRFNSPNDLVIRSNGDIYFTDPPYGLTDKSKRELDFNGVFRLTLEGKVSVVTRELHRPNGIALSPDEKVLYVAQSHQPVATYTKYEVKDDDSFVRGEIVYDASVLAVKDPGLPDGMAVDQVGNLWATGPGGVLVISPDGKLLGRILTGTATSNCTFGEDGSSLFMTAGNYLLRVKTKTKGLTR
jgi:gluconolactonase